MSRGPLWLNHYACAMEAAPLVIAELRMLVAVSLAPPPRWDGDRVRFWIDLDELSDEDDLGCVELSIRRMCERAVGLHAAPPPPLGLKRR